MLDKIKLLLGIGNADLDNDELLNALIDICWAQAAEYTHREVGDTAIEHIVILMVIESYNKLGSEGIASRSFSGVSESAINGYSNSIISQLNPKRKLRVL